MVVVLGLAFVGLIPVTERVFVPGLLAGPRRRGSGALLGATADNYTLVGDPAIFLQGLALAADWLLSQRVDGCLEALALQLRQSFLAGLRFARRQDDLRSSAGELPPGSSQNF